MEVIVLLPKNKERMVLLADRETIKNNNGKRLESLTFHTKTALDLHTQHAGREGEFKTKMIAINK